MSTDVGDVVSVHGDFVDGSGWQGVHRLLCADGFTVTVVQNPTLSVDGGVEATRFVLDGLDGPAVLVGHSCGDAVIREAGAHEPVPALVYTAAPTRPRRDGLLFLDRAEFDASFAADRPAFPADSQVPWGVAALAAAA
jgi:hypothetical protein